MAITIKSEALAKLVAERKANIDNLSKEFREKLEKFAETVVLDVVSGLSVSDFAALEDTVEVRYFNKDDILYAAVFTDHESGSCIGSAEEFEELTYKIPYSLNTGMHKKAAVFYSGGNNIEIPFDEMIFEFPLE